MSKSGRMLTAIVRDRATASRAYEWLQQQGYSTDEISVLMSDQTRANFTKTDSERLKTGDKSAEGIAAGGTVGTAIGATIGAILAIGTSIAIPGLGVVLAGPLVAALAGGGAGAVAGGLVGGLVGLGISESNAHAYEEALRKGGVVFGIVPRNSHDADAIQRYFNNQGAENIVYADVN